MSEDQGRQVASMLNEFGKKLTEVMGKGKEEARNMARAAQIGLEIMTLEGLHLELMVELGEEFYEASGKSGKAKAKSHQRLVSLVARVRELEKRLASLKRALKNPQAKAPGRRGRPPKAAAPKKPGRRGRPPKAKAAAPKKPGRRGRPPKAAKAPAKKAARRGRPPKAAKAPAKKAVRRGRPLKAAPAAAAPAPAPETPSE